MDRSFFNATHRLKQRTCLPAKFNLFIIVCMKDYFIYIMANHRNGTIYIGVTNNLARRVAEHKSGAFPGFTRKYGLKTLVWYQHLGDTKEAVLAEKRLKNWRRLKKVELIEDMNPQWNDLSDFLLPREVELPF
ncbi:MAG: GIY-YIG nuclease family protein [Candidatus Cloacimonadaceae bacterium]